VRLVLDARGVHQRVKPEEGAGTQITDPSRSLPPAPAAAPAPAPAHRCCALARSLPLTLPLAQCSGFNAQGKPDPAWQCNGVYKRTECTDYTCNKVRLLLLRLLARSSRSLACSHDYTCNKANYTCELAAPGAPGKTKAACALGCKKVRSL